MPFNARKNSNDVNNGLGCRDGGHIGVKVPYTRLGLQGMRGGPLRSLSCCRTSDYHASWICAHNYIWSLELARAQSRKGRSEHSQRDVSIPVLLQCHPSQLLHEGREVEVDQRHLVDLSPVGDTEVLKLPDNGLDLLRF